MHMDFVEFTSVDEVDCLSSSFRFVSMIWLSIKQLLMSSEGISKFSEL